MTDRCRTCNSTDPAICWRVNDPRGWEPHPHGNEPTECCPDRWHRIVRNPEQRWVVYICNECNGVGWAFNTGKPCNSGEHTHRGSHGGPVEVRPA